MVTNNTFDFSPRDSTSGLGVKMVEYVLGGSPTNKDSPLSSLEPRLRAFKLDDNEKVSILYSANVRYLKKKFQSDDKEKANSPFDSNGLKKDDQGQPNGVNGIDDDNKGYK